jgi:hypothetical protein
MGTTVTWVLAAALATVAAISGWRMVDAVRGRLAKGRRLGSIVHLAMAIGMVLMVLSPGALGSDPAMRIGFGALGAGLAARSLLSVRRNGSGHGTHGIHHAVMCGVMVLMAGPSRGGSTMAGMSGMAGMGMTQGANTLGADPLAGGPGPSLLMLAAFAYACVLALVFAWRMNGRRVADPLAQACEVTMLTSTIVMLLPMV